MHLFSNPNFKNQKFKHLRLKKSNRRKAFTLIEILVVIMIVGILATIIAINLRNTQTRSRDSKREADLNTLQIATKLYYLDKKSLPEKVDPGKSCIVGTSYPAGICLDEVKDSGYIDKFPINPDSPALNYTYNYYDPDNHGFSHATFFTKMEPERYGPFPYGWNCSEVYGWWAAMKCDSIEDPTELEKCQDNPDTYVAPPGEDLTSAGNTKMYCTGFMTK